MLWDWCIAAFVLMATAALALSTRSLHGAAGSLTGQAGLVVLIGTGIALA